MHVAGSLVLSPASSWHVQRGRAAEAAWSLRCVAGDGHDTSDHVSAVLRMSYVRVSERGSRAQIGTIARI